MSDFLVDLGSRRTARTLVRTLGLPVPLPQRLARDASPYDARPLQGQIAHVYAKGALSSVLARTLARAGARAWIDGDLAPFAHHAEAWSRPAHPIGEAPDSKPASLVFDGTTIDHPDGLVALHSFFKPRIKRLGTCGRVVVLARPAEGLSPAAAAAARGLEGFTRALAKEIGRKGSTANLVTVAQGAEERLEPVLRWLLSKRSAYVSGQPIAVDSTVAPDGSPAELRPLEGKLALVTGAARGIGRATAMSLAREGAHVLCLDRPADDGPVSKVAAEVGGTPVLVDVTAPDAAERITEAIKAAGHEHLDILINNAGVTRDKTLGNMDLDRWNLTLGVNLSAVIRLTETLPLAEGARIVCLSSIAGIAGNVGQTNYSASKCGIIGYVQALAPTLADRGIAVNAIAPGFIETRLTKAIPVATREVARRLCNLSQGGLPTDIAETATFLSTPGAAGLAGNVIRVCGGNLVGA
jgi:3-oxoacyl-[acyl-carrier protein] reductase